MGAIRWTSEHFNGAHAHAVTLAASMKAVQDIGTSTLHTNFLHEDGRVDLPYDSHAGFRVEDQGGLRRFILGAEQDNPSKRLGFDQALLERCIGDLRDVPAEQ